MNNTFLLFYSSKPRSQVWILIYRKWSISRVSRVVRIRDCFIKYNCIWKPRELWWCNHLPSHNDKNHDILNYSAFDEPHLLGKLRRNPRVFVRSNVWWVDIHYPGTMIKIMIFRHYSVFSMSHYSSLFSMSHIFLGSNSEETFESLFKATFGEFIFIVLEQFT